MLYTIVPAEDIFYKETERTLEEKKYKNQTVIVERSGDGYILNRLIATDVSLYADASFAPGIFIAAGELS